MTDKRPSLPRTSLYAPFFKTGVGNPSRFNVAQDQSGRNKLLSILDDIQLLIERTSPEASTRKLLEGHFTRIITDQIKATYSADDFFQFLRDAVRGLDPFEDDEEDDLDNAGMEQEFDSDFPSSKESK